MDQNDNRSTPTEEGSIFTRPLTSRRTDLVMGLVLLIILVIIVPRSCHPVRELATRSACQSNLHQLDVALMAYCYPPATNYPSDLSMLANDVSPEMFVCPGSKNEAGKLTNAMEWMDYIYVTGLSTSTPPGVPVLLCPSEHHKDQGGNILGSDHSTRWYSGPAFDVIISNIFSPTSGYSVIVSERLTKQSKGKYRSKL